MTIYERVKDTFGSNECFCKDEPEGIRSCGRCRMLKHLREVASEGFSNDDFKDMANWLFFVAHANADEELMWTYDPNEEQILKAAGRQMDLKPCENDLAIINALTSELKRLVVGQ